MLRSKEFLRSYARFLHHLSGAAAVSLFLPPSPEGPDGGVLIHQNGQPAVPELADASAAIELLRTVDLRFAGAEGALRHQFPSRAPGGRLIGIATDSRSSLPGPGTDDAMSRSRRKADHECAASASPTLWIGLRQAVGAGLAEEGGLWHRALSLGGVLAGHCQQVDAVLSDSVTELPGRADFQVALRRGVRRAHERACPLTLVLVNPDDFSLVNERFGSDGGDAVVREIARRLQGMVRRSDLVHRYGGVVFAVLLPETSRADAVIVAQKLDAELTERAYLEGALRLGFGFGLATFDPTTASEALDDVAWQLIRRADRALSQAKLATSGGIVAWTGGEMDEVLVHRDRLSGIFTADLSKDYRNMLLLWETVEMMTARADPEELAERAVELLAATFKPGRAGLFRWGDEGGPRLVADHVRVGDALERPAERALLERARSEGRLVEGRAAAASPGGEAEPCYAVPLVARGECLGCLYLAGRPAARRLDASDLIFLKALAGQLAAALDRAELAQRELRRRERESQRLRTELEELRNAVAQSRLIYRSPQMKLLLQIIGRVAPTEATVLLTGPSGTGKELVARTLHNLSPRRGKPPVVVDCGAISASLIDSELFGHERGAFTGAAGRTVGRLAEAAGSTLILDEIGELPLEVQSKLLRFVQERQIIPVGGTRPRTVDVRLVAVTHRDLKEDVASGRFREDLYYRLKVIHLQVPPLAERPDDIALLAGYFLQKFVARYHKDIRGLSPEAEALMALHSWPGNVRELENRILQAVILCEGEEIGPRDLELDADNAPSASSPDPVPGGGRRVEATASTPGGTNFGVGLLPDADQAWEALRQGLRNQIEVASTDPPPPLGRWLADDLLLETRTAADGVLRQGAALAGIPESTFARRVAKADVGERLRGPGWEKMRPLLTNLVRASHPPGVDLLEGARQKLIEELAAGPRRPAAESAALVGVTGPTFRRLKKSLQARGC